MVPDHVIDGRRLEASCLELIDRYDVAGWWPAQTRFEVLVGAVLVQNTRWTNVSAAIEQLRRAGNLDARRLCDIDTLRLQELIRAAGCQRVKAHRLISLAAWIEAAGGLASLARWPTSPLRAALLGVHGVGNETADTILAFGFGRRVFVADRYARMWLMRLGIIADAGARYYESCRRAVEAALIDSPVCLKDLHAAIVLHGQARCGRQPRCQGCLLLTRCRRIGVVSRSTA